MVDCRDANLNHNVNLNIKMAIGLWYLLSSNQLTTLHVDLRSTRIPLADGLWQRCVATSLTDLSVSASDGRFSDFLRTCSGPWLKRLHIGLAGAHLSDAATVKLGHMLSLFPNLCCLQLDLRNNEVMDVGFNAILVSIQSLTLLTALQLRLPFNRITMCSTLALQRVLELDRWRTVYIDVSQNLVDASVFGTARLVAKPFILIA